MYIIIEDNYSLHKFYLDKQIEYKSIKIYENNNQYYIALKDNYYFDDNKKIKKLIYTHYKVNVENLYYQINIYVYKSIKGIDDYALYRNKSIKISSDDDSDIKTYDPFLKDKYLIISNGILKTNHKAIVNNNQYNNLTLKQNDLIEFLGLRIIYFDNFLYINHFLSVFKIPLLKVNEHLIKYNYLICNDNYYLPNDIKKLEIEELKEFKEVKDNTSKQIYKSLMPNMMMILSIASLSFINYYNASTQGKDLLSKISYLIMPVSMFVSTLILPLLFYLIDIYQHKKARNKAIDEYLSYLDEYHLKIKSNISEYVSDLNSHYFDLINKDVKMFYAWKNSVDYLRISIGKTSLEHKLIFDKTDCDKINLKLDDIKNCLLNIENIPLFLDLNKYDRVTVITKKSLKKFYFYKFILETCYKHHYDDINIAIYCKDLSIVNEIYNIPHLFISDKRLTLDSLNDLQELNQRRLDKPLILFMYDNSDFVFSNPFIKILYFSNNKRDLYKDFNSIIEYNHNNGYLYTDCHIDFTYYQEDINFNYYFNELSKYHRITSINNKPSFRNVYYNFDIQRSYLNNNTGLKSVFAYNNNELISLDLHESKQGPHGLIGGSTGSGKSELIVSLLLGMCIRYSPDYLNIILIDYKGGGIKESLTHKGICIPHITACVSNLENNAFKRLIIALNHQCLIRQKAFKKLSSETNISIMNIDDYNQNSNDRIPHLLVVVDEFAQLKKENPELIKELISISRIGRSLGIHLILATQKPSGNIDDEIWSNSRFKLSLKVFEEKDSMDILKIKDGAYLKTAGSFLMKIDESIIEGQSMFSKRDIYLNEPYEVSVLNNTLDSVSSYKIQNNNIHTEASYFCNKIIKACEELNLKIDKLEFLPPDRKHRKELSDNDGLIFGQIDDYINNDRGILKFDIKDNILIYSERKDEINSVLNTLNEHKRKTIIIGSKQYHNKSISDSLLYDQNEDIIFLLDKINTSGLDICLVIEDLNLFLTYNDNYLNILYSLIKRSEAGDYNIICFTSYSCLNFRILNVFKNKIMIENSDINNINNFFMMKSQYDASSFYFDEKPISFIPIYTEEFISENCVLDKVVNSIPETIMKHSINGKHLIGYDAIKREKIFIDEEILITSYDDKLLEYYKNYCDKFMICKYDHSLIKKHFDKILWLGPGIYSQRLFISNHKKELLNFEGLLIEKGKEYLVRIINYV